MKRIKFHADDFGYGGEVDEHILDCCRQGAVCSVSLLPNSPSAPEAMRIFFDEGLPQTVFIHFNLAEGPALSRAASGGLLTDSRGMMRLSFFQVLTMSLSADRHALRRQIKEELRAQLRAFLSMLKQCGVPWGRARRLNVDSHQHYHMIPMVLEVMLEVIKEEECVVEHIRIPAEPLSVFLAHPELWASLKPLNLVKNLVLGGLNLVNLPTLMPFRDRSDIFLGLMLSGSMDKRRVGILLPDLIRLAREKGRSIEVLAHPGGADPSADREEFLDPKNRGCVRFYTSRGRRKEKDMLLHFADVRNQREV